MRPGVQEDPLRAHELRAAELLRKCQPVVALAELEAALCLCEKRGLESASGVRHRWQQLAASALSWSLDFLADAGLAQPQPGPGRRSIETLDQALEMLCLCEMLTRREVAETFSAGAAPTRLFLRAIGQAGLGAYYYLRQKPRAAVRFLQQAASGHARWAHPAVLLNLSAAHASLREANEALEALNKATLALRSAAGRLCGDNLQEVDQAAKAARAAVSAVLGPPQLERSQAYGDGGASLYTPSTYGGLHDPELDAASVLAGAGPATSLQAGKHTATPRMNSVEAAVTHTLLVAKVLLWPWPEFREEEAVASGALSTDADSKVALGQPDAEGGLPQRLRKLSAPGIARHASQLAQAWSLWGKPMPALDVPGGGLVLRECLLLAFLQAAAALSQCCPESSHSAWLLPPLREGLALAVVLFGPKHPLSLKLINSCQKVQRPQTNVSRPPTKTRSSPSPTPGPLNSSRRTPSAQSGGSGWPRGSLPKGEGRAVSPGAASSMSATSVRTGRSQSPGAYRPEGSLRISARPRQAGEALRYQNSPSPSLRQLSRPVAPGTKRPQRPASTGGAPPCAGGGLGVRLRARALGSLDSSRTTTPRLRSKSPGGPKDSRGFLRQGDSRQEHASRRGPRAVGPSSAPATPLGSRYGRCAGNEENDFDFDGPFDSYTRGTYGR